MSETTRTEADDLVRGLLDDQRERWRRGERRPVEDYLRAYPGLADNPEGVLDLIYHERKLDAERGAAAGVGEYLLRFPQFRAALRDQFEVDELLAPAELLGVAATLGPAGAETLADAPAIPGYEVRERIGRGGMSVVYRAWQPSLKRDVVIKVINESAPVGRERAADRFQAEAEAIARLQHSHIVQIHEVGRHDGRPYLVLEYMAGGGLDRRLAGTPRPPTEAAMLAQTLARAIHSAHERGVVHRDLKPANVLLTADGLPKISDFGLAKLVGAEPAGASTSGAVLGTPSYMPPEQAEGRAGAVGPPADVYSLGAILYEALTGRPPFRADSAFVTLQQVILVEPVPPRRLQPGVPRDLETICLKCLEKDPRKRYASALALADDLRRFLAREPIRARPVGALGRALKWARRQPLAAALTGACAAAVLALLAVSLSYAWHVRRVADDLRRKGEETEAALRRADAAVDGSLDVLDRMLFAESFRERPRTMGPQERKFLEDMLALYEKSLQENPSSPKVRERVARVLDRVGFLLYRLMQDERAEEVLLRSVEMHRALAEQFPDEPHRRHDLANALHSLGMLRADTRRTAEAERTYKEALALDEKLMQDDPGAVAYQEGVARRNIGLGDLYLWKVKAPKTALPYLKQAYERLEQVVQHPGATPAHHGLLGWAHEKYANAVLRSRGEPAEVCRHLERAIEELHVALAHGASRTATLQKIICDAHKNLAKEWVKRRDPAKAAEVLTALGRLEFGVSSGHSYDAAWTFIDCARLAAADRAAAQKYEEQAVAALRRAARDGYADREGGKGLQQMKADRRKLEADTKAALPLFAAALDTAIREAERKEDGLGRW
jgi:tetratricopeptide (TPR) repeat protein